MTFREPWYLLALATAQRAHSNDPVTRSGRPVWRECADIARHLVELFPDATPDQVGAAMLHRTMRPDGSLPRSVRDATPTAMLRTLAALHRMRAGGPVDDGADRVRIAIENFHLQPELA